MTNLKQVIEKAIEDLKIACKGYHWGTVKWTIEDLENAIRENSDTETG